MRGQYNIHVSDAKVCYNFTISRKITVIKGASATGKTVLVNMIANARYSKTIQVTGATCVVIPYSALNWKHDIAELHNSILFFDENCLFVKTKEFAEIVKKSDCYFVLVTRNPLEALPYSIDEVYEIVEDRKYPKLKKTYNTFVHRYKDLSNKIKPDLILIEDKKSGFQFMQAAFKNIPSNTCDGKSNVQKTLQKVMSDRILVIVDGAAFGSNIDSVISVAKSKKIIGKQVEIYAPESFEWLILRSRLFYDKCKDELNKTYDYADSCTYESWEQYYTDLLITITKGTPAAYTKSKLGDYYLGTTAMNAIKEMYDCIIEDSLETMDVF